jgi:hypothetical protein
MTEFLREQLVGAWALMSFVERDIETGVENRPFGEHPLGLILYTRNCNGPNGLHLMAPVAVEEPTVERRACQPARGGVAGGGFVGKKRVALHAIRSRAVAARQLPLLVWLVLRRHIATDAIG